MIFQTINKKLLELQSRTKIVWTTAKNGVTDTTSNVQPI